MMMKSNSMTQTQTNKTNTKTEHARMAVTDFFAGEIATELLRTLTDISRKSILCRGSADQLITYIKELLPTIQEIKYSGVELPPTRQYQLDRLSEILHSGVELSHKVLNSSRWNVYRNYQLAKKMERLEKNVSRFMKGPMQAHILADVHHTRFEMAERFDRVEASNRRLENYFCSMKLGMGGGGWVEEAMKSMEVEKSWVEGSLGNLGVGLEIGKKKVKDMVLGKNDVWVVGIHGIGGLGKTTLAREVCTDEQVRCYFKERILFLTVSQSPNVEQLRTRIWGFIMGNDCLTAGYAVPQWMPQFGCKTEARNLIVLDDVWSLTVLEQLVCRIPGCKFVVVSREKFPICNATYEVELLTEDDALSLFCHHAFGQKSIPVVANENLVKQVMTECGRLPLALKVIGASLRGQNEMFWESVKARLSQGQSIGESYQNNLIERMATSVNYLPEKIKECFLDLCSFPEDKKIPLDILINVWVEIHDISETEAFAIVVELSNKNLLTLVKEARAGSMYSSCFEISVTQHDILRDLALNLSNRGSICERRRLVMPKREESGLSKEWLRYTDKPCDAQIVSIHTSEMKEEDWCNLEFPKAEVLIINFASSEYFLPPFIEKMPNLRALIVINYSASYARLHNVSVFKNLTNLRSLWLEKVSTPRFSGIVLKNLGKLCLVLCKVNNSSMEGKESELHQIFPNLKELTLDHCDDVTELPSSICEINSLKNLSLTNCHNLTKLPFELGKLRSLEILRLYACPDLKSFPNSFCDMVRLKYIDISQCVNLACFPEEIGKLVNLEKIDMRECSMIRCLPKSTVSLKSLRLVICDEEVSGMWIDVEKAKPNVHIQVSEQQFDLDWLKE